MVLPRTGPADGVGSAPTQGRSAPAFQEARGYVPPRWPSIERSQQFHLDFHVPREELDAAEREALELGAELLQGDGGRRGFRVYLDPAGHPFCLRVD
ncbi:VOC family protein [Streptomyces sp. CNQ085]|uniref:VOC family protein n=1 Tax=Streptomyces sp. CNQ085 TaxID=2886944 RepID=UPI0035AF88F7